jgi:putative membrane protein
MKTNKYLYAIVIAALGWVACDDDDDNILDKPNLNETDETFVEVAARANMAEIEFGELAVTKGTDSLVKEFAQHMVDEHNAAQDELEELADDYAGIEWPNDLDEGHDEVMEQLNAAEPGRRFDSLYIATQVTSHENSANTFQTATTNTTDARVKAYANKYLPKIELHLERADSIQTEITSDAAADGRGGTGDGTDDGTN